MEPPRSPQSPPPTSPPDSSPLPRILCLHGFRQTVAQFGYRAATLQKRLRSVADFIFIDAPHALPDLAATEARYDDHQQQSRPRRAWLLTPEQYNCRDSTGGIDSEQYRRQTAGWTESSAVIDDTLSNGQFDGLLGFSQGAAVAAAVAAAEARRPPADRRFQFVVLCSGYLPPVSECETLLEQWKGEGGVPLPSLHVFGGGGDDRQVGRPDSEALASCFAPEMREIVRHDAGHLVPSAREVTDAIASFIGQQTTVALPPPTAPPPS